MTTKVSIATGEARTVVVVEQPDEPKHTRDIEPQSGYDFEVTGPVRVSIGYPENTTVEAVASGEPLSEDAETPAEEPVPNPDADFEAENDANEHTRTPRKR